MNISLSARLLAAAALLAGLVITPLEAADAKAQLGELVERIKDKLEDGKNTEPDLAEDLKAFDALIQEHAGEKTDDVAQILVMKAMLFVQVLEQPEKGLDVLKQLQRDYPETAPGQNAERMIANVERVVASTKIQRQLAVGTAWPDFKETDLAGKPLSVSAYRGKVVLIDFWATWCGPCISELPHVLTAYRQYHDKGFEIIGISLDNDKQKLLDFIKEHQMPWPQYFDGQGWQTKLAGVYGVNSIPATYLLDKEGKIAAKNLRGPALERELAKLLD